MSKLNEIEVLTESTNNLYHIKFTSGKYNGIVFKLGRVSINEDGKEAVLSFDCDIIENPIEVFDNDDFNMYVGDLLIDMITEQLDNNELVYTGGVDENRDDNIIESDIE